MATIEGIRRIRRLGSAIALWGGMAGLLLWCAILFGRGGFGIVELVIMAGFPVLFGGMIRVICWVLEGFAAERPSCDPFNP